MPGPSTPFWRPPRADRRSRRRATRRCARFRDLAGRPAKRWPTPVLDLIEEPATGLCGRFSAWGHRKIWAMLRAGGVCVSASSVARAMKRQGLLLPVRYQRERRAFAAAIVRAEELLLHDLAGDCVDLETGEVARLRVVTDNGAAFKSDAFWRFIESRPYVEHIRTRHYAPETNGVVERFNQSLGWRQPLAVHRGDQHPFRASSLQHP